LFLGTPHDGIAFSRYGLLMSYLLSPLDSDIGIMRILGPGNRELRDLQNEFDGSFNDTPRRYFYEKSKTYHRLFGFIPWMQEFARHSPSC
jgi:hypothetical protein